MGFFGSLFGPPPIQNPTLGFLDLSWGSAADLIAGDRAALAPLFHSTVETSGPAPRCSVLMIYCSIDPSGAIRGSSQGIRELIRDSEAKVAVIATPNPGQRYAVACRKKTYGRANLVMTIDRKGPAFPAFFSSLFTEMSRGASMAAAWVKLSPQIPSTPSYDKAVPGTIFSCELAQLKFQIRP
jgi:hypothetical protein